MRQRDPWGTKLSRAARHIESLRSGIENYLDTDPKPRIDVQTVGDSEFRLILRVPSEPPDEWAAVIGDALHNVRSALDALAWAVVERHMSRALTGEEERRVAFPITKRAKDFRSSQWAPSDLPLWVRKKFREMQPFADACGLGLPSQEVSRAVANHPLTLLQRWSNVDKHRGLHPVVCLPDSVWVGLSEGARAEWMMAHADAWPWHEGSTIGHVRIAGQTSEPHFGDQLSVVLAEEAGPLKAPPVVARLNAVLGQAGSVAWALRMRAEC